MQCFLILIDLLTYLRAVSDEKPVSTFNKNENFFLSISGFETSIFVIVVIRLTVVATRIYISCSIQ